MDKTDKPKVLIFSKRTRQLVQAKDALVRAGIFVQLFETWKSVARALSRGHYDLILYEIYSKDQNSTIAQIVATSKNPHVKIFWISYMQDGEIVCGIPNINKERDYFGIASKIELALHVGPR